MHPTNLKPVQIKTLNSSNEDSGRDKSDIYYDLSLITDTKTN
jgi:hypothetical protein